MKQSTKNAIGEYVADAICLALLAGLVYEVGFVTAILVASFVVFVNVTETFSSWKKYWKDEEKRYIKPDSG